jgi:hypothetical protein
MTPHRLTHVDPDARTATCSVCGPVRVRYKGLTRGGLANWRCGNRQTYGRADRPSQRHRSGAYRVLIDLSVCVRCGFVPECAAQVEVHHRDRDRANNDVSNLMALCANCHTLAHMAPDLF